MKRHQGLGQGEHEAKNFKLASSYHGATVLTSLPYCATSERLRSAPEPDPIMPSQARPSPLFNDPTRFEIYLPTLEHLEAVDTRQIVADQLARSSSKAARDFREAKREGRLTNKGIEAFVYRLTLKINLVANTLGPAEPVERFERFLRDAEGTDMMNVERKFIAYFEVLVPRPGALVGGDYFHITKHLGDEDARCNYYPDIMEILGYHQDETVGTMLAPPPIFDIAFAVLDLPTLAKAVRCSAWAPKFRVKAPTGHLGAMDSRCLEERAFQDQPFLDLATSLNGLAPTLFDYQVSEEDSWMWRVPGAGWWPQRDPRLPYNYKVPVPDPPTDSNPPTDGDASGGEAAASEDEGDEPADDDPSKAPRWTDDHHRLAFVRLAAIDLLHVPEKSWGEVPVYNNSPRWQTDSPKMKLMYGPSNAIFKTQGMPSPKQAKMIKMEPFAPRKALIQYTENDHEEFPWIGTPSQYFPNLHFLNRHLEDDKPPYDWGRREPTQAMFLLADLHGLVLGKINGPTRLPDVEKTQLRQLFMEVEGAFGEPPQRDPAVDEALTSSSIKRKYGYLDILTPTPWDWVGVTPSVCALPYKNHAFPKNRGKFKTAFALSQLSPLTGLFHQTLYYKHWETVQERRNQNYAYNSYFFNIFYRGAVLLTQDPEFFFALKDITYKNTTCPPYDSFPVASGTTVPDATKTKFHQLLLDRRYYHFSEYDLRAEHYAVISNSIASA